jgi:hypothetical protein
MATMKNLKFSDHATLGECGVEFFTTADVQNRIDVTVALKKPQAFVLWDPSFPLRFVEQSS